MSITLPAPLRRLYELGMQTYVSWRGDRTLRLGAGLSYYALFTIIPFLAVTAAIAEPLVGEADLRTFLTERLVALGLQTADATAGDVTTQLSGREQQTSLGLVGGVSLLFAASLLFLALTDAMNTIWHVPVESGWRNTVRRRMLSFAMVLISSAAIVLQLAMSAIVGAAEALVPGNIELLETLAPVLTSGLSLAGLTGTIALLYRFMSPEDVQWRVAVISGVATALLLTLGTSAIGWYMRAFGGSSMTGAFGAILALLSWVYIEAQFVLAGAQLSKVLTVGPGWDPPVEQQLPGADDQGSAASTA